MADSTFATFVSMRPETFQPRRVDPGTTARLGALRDALTKETDAIASISARRVRDADVAASRARASQVAATHARLETATEAGRRAPDRAYYIRPYGELDKNLWAAGDLRTWYGGGEGGALSGPDFGTATLGQTLSGGYTMSASEARRAPQALNPHALDAPAVPDPNVPLNTVRAAATASARSTLNRTHWSDREGLLVKERSAAVEMAVATGYTPDLVTSSRPFKSRPAAEENGTRFVQLPPSTIRDAMLTARIDGARENVGNAVRARETKHIFMATDSRNFY